jgi:hypothetical protein
MESCSGHGGSEQRSEEVLLSTEYEVILKFSVQDVASLWRAAAQRLHDGGLEADDVDETIGPMDDPIVSDCLATLALPEGLDGCDLVSFDVHSASRPPLMFNSAELPILREIREITPAEWRAGLGAAPICQCKPAISPETTGPYLAN